MVKIDANSSHQIQNSQEVMSVILLSIGVLTLVVSLFFGIKWKRFRYRMTFQNTPGENVISIRRHSTTPTIRENCSEGVYRHSTTEELITSGNDIQPVLRNPSTYNVKLERSDRESIFRWPFRNKMTVNKSNFTIDENRVLDSNEEAVTRRQRDSVIAEKNERLRRSIYERLNSSGSMPDLVNDSQPGTYERKIEEPILQLQKGVESELDEASHYQIVDEIQHLESVESIPVRVKESPINDTSAKIPEINSQNKANKNDKDDEDIQNKTPPRPPARRRSRASSLTPSEEKEKKQDIQEFQRTAPVVKPRKRNTYLIIEVNEALKEYQDSSLSKGTTTVEQKFDENSRLNLEAVDSKQIENSIVISPTKKEEEPPLVISTVANKQTEDSSLSIETVAPKQDKNSSLSAVTLIQNEDSSSNANIMTPKSILKTQHDTPQQSKSSVQFKNVPDSSSSSEDEDYDDKNDVWSKIDIHRKHLMMDHEFNRVYISSSPSDSPPPLPKTPPPTADIQERNFQFA